MSEHGVDPIGVVGDADVETQINDAGIPVETATPAAIPDTDRLVTVGQDAITAVARADADPLVVPIDAGRGVRSVPRDSVVEAVETIDDAVVEEHPILEVTVDDGPVSRAVWDVTLVTEDAAHISEYSIETSTDHVGTFRADGIVTATAAGSPDYARRIGGPVMAPRPVAAVVPIAPFATNPDHWVLPIESLSFTVERDEATVSLLVDGDDSGTVGDGDSVTVYRADTLRVAVVEASRSRFR